MTTINRLMTLLFDVVFAPFVRAPGWLSLIVFSMVASLAGLLVYKYTSNQKAIKRTKDRIKASILAIKLFKDELGVIGVSLLRVVVGAINLLRYSLLPLIILIVPFVLGMAQLAMRYQWRPLEVGENAVLSVTLAEGHNLVTDPVTIDAGDGVAVETPAVRIAADRRVVWRLRASRPGEHIITLRQGDQLAEQSVTVGGEFQCVNPVRSRGIFWDALLYPTAPPLPDGSAISRIAIDCPVRDSWFAGADWWIVWLIGLSFVFAFVLKPVLRVEF